MTEGERKRVKAAINGRCLLLKPDYTPTKVISAKKAICEVLKGSAIQVEGTGVFANSPSTSIEIPFVIAKFRSSKRTYPKKEYESIPVTTRAVLARDHRVCAYQRPTICDGEATTMDHIKPKAKGGKNRWTNVVAACRGCNHKKGDRTLAELGWELRITPWEPRGATARALLHAHNPDWHKYFAKAA